MPARSFVVVLALLAGTPATAAADVVLNLVPASPAVRCEVTAVSVKAAGRATVDIPLPQTAVVAGAPTAIRVALPQLPAAVVPVANRCWAAPLEISADPATPADVQMWAAATVLGGLAFEAKAGSPRSITGSFTDSNDDRGRMPVACALDAKVWRCTVPAERPLHLQVAVDDFAPLFVWDVNLAAAAVHDSGIQTLARGAAVAGRALLDGGQPAANARVRILPITSGHQSQADRAAKSRETRASAGGHFQLAGLEAGVYRLVSTVDGRGDAVVESLELRAGEHLRLRDPLFHAELAELVALLSPPVSSGQAPWSVELLRNGERDMEIVSVTKGPASADGSWSRRGLQPMKYHLRVIAPNGSTVAARDIVLRGGREQIAIDLSVIRVTGKILAGDEGVAAELTFDKDRLRVTAKSDEDGAFTAELPVEGLWKPRVTVGRTKVRLEPVEIAASPQNELILRIPGAGVRGKVLDPDGKPAADVLVRLDRTGSHSSTVSDEDGKYELVGVEAGTYIVEAESRANLVAGPLPVTLAADRLAEVDLRLEAWKEVTGVVTSAGGAAASGAVVRSFDPITGEVEDTFADARGAFAFRVKPQSLAIDVIVLAPPAPVAVRRVATGERRVVSANLQLAPAGARLRAYIPRTPPWATLIGADGVARSLGLFLMPLFDRGDRPEFVDGGFNFLVEPGPYRVCYGEVPCRDVQLAAHAETVVNLVPTTAGSTVTPSRHP